MTRTFVALLRSNKGSSEVLKAILNDYLNYRSIRQFKSSVGLCASSEKDAALYPSPAQSSKSGMHAASPTLSQQNNRTSQYEPTLIANPSVTPATTTTNTTKSDVSQAQTQVASQAQSSQTSTAATITEINALNQDLQLSKKPKKDPPKVTLNQVDPRTLSKVYYFDSLALSKKLEGKGFTREQAEGCVQCLLEVIGDTLEHQAKHMITKSEQKIVEQQLQTEIMSVKKDMVLLQKSEFSALRTETQKISVDIDRIQSHFQDEVVKLKGQFTLDVNLERGRAVEAHAVSEKNLQMLNNKIETEIAHLKTTYEVYRNDIFKYAAGTVLTCTTLIIGFIRLWK